jgi:2-polyprenyl-3-methyl-5-hydroxy-6-metoxy-1,4-benzoquinol methylase
MTYLDDFSEYLRRSRVLLGHKKLRDEGRGLNDILEQPALCSLIAGSLDGCSILDLGGGFGYFAREARTLGADAVLGVDLSKKCWLRAGSARATITSNTGVQLLNIDTAGAELRSCCLILQASLRTRLYAELS